MAEPSHTKKQALIKERTTRSEQQPFVEILCGVAYHLTIRPFDRPSLCARRRSNGRLAPQYFNIFYLPYLLYTYLLFEFSLPHPRSRRQSNWAVLLGAWGSAPCRSGISAFSVHVFLRGAQIFQLSFFFWGQALPQAKTPIILWKIKAVVFVSLNLSAKNYITIPSINCTTAIFQHSHTHALANLVLLLVKIGKGAWG